MAQLSYVMEFGECFCVSSLSPSAPSKGKDPETIYLIKLQTVILAPAALVNNGPTFTFVINVGQLLKNCPLQDKKKLWESLPSQIPKI